MIPLDLFGHEDPEEYAARRHRELYEETEKITYPSHEALAEAIRSTLTTTAPRELEAAA